jgi:hypothetical protein
MSRLGLKCAIEEELLLKVREIAVAQGLDGVDDVIEKALRIFFANCSATVWERQSKDGWIDKLVIKPEKAVFEHIRCRNLITTINPKYYSPEALESKGWKQVWKCRI